MFRIGEVLNQTYQIEGILGSGGGGEVYRAYHLRLKTEVAVKRVKDNVRGRLNDRAEADVLKKLRHSHLPQIYDFVSDDEDIYTVMEYIPGQNLKQAVKEHGPFDQQQVLKWAIQLSDALAYLHSQKIPVIHSDIKPENIMLQQDGNICLIDFNVSLAFDESVRKSTGISIGYAPPEQFHSIRMYGDITHLTEPQTSFTTVTGVSGVEEKAAALLDRVIGQGVDERSDVYSLGATLYFLLTGTRPSPKYWENVPVKMMGTSVSEGLAHIIDTCMQLDPDKRYQNGSELQEALSHVTELDSRYKALQNGRRNRRILLAALYAASVLLIVLGVTLRRREAGNAYTTALLQAESLMDEERFDEAQEVIAGQIRQRPGSIEAYEKQLECLYRSGDYEGCISQGRQMINAPEYSLRSDEDYRTLADMYYLIGNAYYETGDYGNAVQVLEYAINYDPDNSLYHRDLALSQARAGNLDQAEAELQTAVDKGLSGDSVTLIEGELLYVKGSYREAVDSFRRTIDSASSEEVRGRAILLCASAYRRLCLQEGTGEAAAGKDTAGEIPAQEAATGEAIAWFTDTLSGLQDRPALAGQLTEQLAELYALTGRSTEAIDLYESLVRGGTASYRARENLAVLLQEADRFEDARAVLEDLAEQYPNRYEVYKRLAFLEADLQSTLPQGERDYSRTEEYADQAAALYGSASDDAEMARLTRLIEDLYSAGWLEE